MSTNGENVERSLPNRWEARTSACCRTLACADEKRCLHSGASGGKLGEPCFSQLELGRIKLLHFHWTPLAGDAFFAENWASFVFLLPVIRWCAFFNFFENIPIFILKGWYKRSNFFFTYFRIILGNHIDETKTILSYKELSNKFILPCLSWHKNLSLECSCKIDA